MNATKSPKLTDLNVGVLAELVAYHGGRTSFPNEMPHQRFGGSTKAHLRRCVQAGWLVIEGKRLSITDEAKAAVVAWLSKEVARWEARGFGTGITEDSYRARFEEERVALANLTNLAK